LFVSELFVDLFFQAVPAFLLYLTYSLTHSGTHSLTHSFIFVTLIYPRRFICLQAPYILVMLSLDDKILAKEQTKRKRTASPVWNSGFLFDIDPSRLNDYAIIIRVMNYDMLLSNESIGEVVISSHAIGTGRKHWNEMVKAKNRETAMCHQLL